MADLCTLADVVEFLGLGPTASLQAQEQDVIPSGAPYTVTVGYAQSFVSDVSVVNYATGVTMTKVAASPGPSTGQYSVLNGVYTFAAADAGKTVVITYNYSVTHLLQRLISDVSGDVQHELGLDIASQSYAETRDGMGNTKMPFKQFPVTAVSSVVIDSVTIPVSTAYQMRGYRFSETMLYLEGYEFNRGFQNVAIQYTAGYATIPSEVNRYVIKVVGLEYKERDRLGIQSKSLAGETVSYKVWDPTQVRKDLSAHRKVIPV